MKIAVNMESFAPAVKARRMELDDCVRASTSMSVEAIELMDLLIADADIAPLKAVLDEERVPVCSYDIHCNLVAPDEFVREGQLAKVRVGLERAALFNAPLALIIPGVLPD